MIILYGSQTGNAQDVAEELSEILTHAMKKRICAVPMDGVNLDEMVSQQLILIVCSTTGQGDVPLGMRSCWKMLLRKNLPATLLNNVYYSVFGLGDSGYLKYNVVAKKVDRRFEQLGAIRLVERGLGDEQDVGGYDTALDTWVNALLNAIKNIEPRISIERPPADTSKPSKYRVEVHDRSLDSEVSHVLGQPSSLISQAHLRDCCAAAAAFDSLAGRMNGTLNPNSAETSQGVFGSPHSPCWASVSKTERMTDEEHFQTVQHIEFDIHGLGECYNPGDVLTVFPFVPESIGKRLLQRLGINPGKWVTVGINSEWLPGDGILAKAAPKASRDAQITVPALALACGVLDVASCSPRRRVFQHFATYASEPRERERLLHFASHDGRGDLATYCTKERRTILDVLCDFPSVDIPLAQLLHVAPRLRPRQFSISSSPLQHPGAVHITVAKAFKSICRMQIPVWIEKGSLKLPPPDVPLICVGPGTGVAPFRSFLQERAALVASGAPVAPSILFFGCRNEAKDFLYAKEWKQLQEQGVLDKDNGLVCAFSRDQAKKRYVQHCIEEHRALLWKMLHDQNAHVFVAGSADKMPEAVSSAFVSVIESGLGCSRQEAQDLLKRLEAARRYAVESWS